MTRKEPRVGIVPTTDGGADDEFDLLALIEVRGRALRGNCAKDA
jgi:hypothetical protein